MLEHVLHNSERRCADYSIFLGLVCTQAIVTGDGRQGGFGFNRDGGGLTTSMAALGDYRKLELRTKTKHILHVNYLFTCIN